MTWLTSSVGLQMLKDGWPSWNPDLARRAANLKPVLEAADPDHLRQALNREILKRISEFIDGIMAYRRHDYRRNMDDPPEIWREGGSRLLDYAAGDNGRALPILVVPSLVNRAYVLDLREDRSFLRAMAQAGLRPLLLDWGAPGADERHFSLTDYIGGRLAHALTAVRKITNTKPILLGYCMGGTLAVPLAQSQQTNLCGLAVIAAPWDFHAAGVEQSRAVAALLAGPLGAFIDLFGEAPVDALQAMFAALSPLDSARKYRQFAEQAARDDGTGRDAARAFTALEDWLNDGVPLAGAVARECLDGWYGRNEPARGAWRIDDMPVQPEAIHLPALAVIPDQDRIVPPESALPLAKALPDCQTLQPDLGHIGMVVSRRAPDLAWKPIFDWLHERTEVSALA